MKVLCGKRPIDVLRDSGKSMQVGGDGDDSAISEMIPIGDTLYMIKERSIYAVQLADQIDPDRTNAAIPDTQQQILSIGAGAPVVARTLLTAHTLFRKNLLGPSFDEQRGLRLAFELLQDIVAMSGMLTELEGADAHARASFEAQKPQRNALRLPAIGNLKARCDAFAQKGAHVVNTLEEIAKLFYRNELASKWVDSLTALSAERCGEESPFAQYMNDVRPFLLFVLGMRNMIEHPAPGKYIEVRDFRLVSSGQIAPPAVEIVRPGEEPEIATISLLMKKVIDDLVSVSEVLMAHLCNLNVQPFAGMPIQVVELPEDQRPNKHQRFFYGCMYGDQIVRFG
jgi:hypothetical protein